MNIGPQPGPQRIFMETLADIAIFGGSAGSGKSFALLLEPLRHYDNPKFGAVVYRRNSTQIRNQGGLWQESMGLYTQFGAHPREAFLEWRFPSGMRVKFAHLEHDKTVYDWQGSQIPLLCVAKNTLILMADGSYVEIQNLKVGDLVQTLRGPKLITKIFPSRKEKCVLVKTYAKDGGYLGEQIHPYNHPILTSFGWFSYDDLKPLYGKDSFSIQSHDLDKSCSPEMRKSRMCAPSFSSTLMNQEHVARQVQSFQGNCGNVASVFSPKDGQNYNEAFDDERQEIQRPQELTVPVMLFLPYSHLMAPGAASKDDRIFSVVESRRTLLDILQQLKYCNYIIQVLFLHLRQLKFFADECIPESSYKEALGQFLASCKSLSGHTSIDGQLLFQDQFYGNLNSLLHEVQDVLVRLIPADYQDDYLLCSDLCDERLHLWLKSARLYLRQLNDAGEQAVQLSYKRDAILLAQEHIQTCHIEYAHPYTKEVRQSSSLVSFGTCDITPYGEHEVFDLSIEEENHYITINGLVNQNCFDELTHFTAHQFFYMLSRNRSMSGVPGYVRCTTNPDCSSFVRDLIDWWIGEDGFPIKERSGVLRWFIRRDDTLIWADSREELVKNYGEDELPKSLTFISALITDNPILMEKDPAYMANLRSLSRVERMRLLGGNWDVKEAAGMLFQKEWFEVIDTIPGGWISAIRCWDRAATKPSNSNKDPDWTRGLLLYRYPNNLFLIADLKSIRDTPGKVETLIKNVASHDSQAVRVMSQQDPGSAGVAEADNFKRMLAGFDVRTVTISKDKITRAKPVSAQAEAGNIKVLRAPWNNEFFDELENFPVGQHDDCVDVLSLGFNELCTGNSIMDVFHLMKAKP